MMGRVRREVQRSQYGVRDEGKTPQRHGSREQNTGCGKPKELVCDPRAQSQCAKFSSTAT